MRLSFLVISIILISGCVQQTNTYQNYNRISPQGGTGGLTESEIMKKASFQTTDGVEIVANYWHGSEKAVLLLHMMPATKESWNNFAAALNKENFSILAIDLRGHGESTQQDGNILDYNRFSDEQHQESIKDVDAAVRYMKNNGAAEIYIAGASIGANLAIQYQAQHKEIKKTILLSAGANYRGILTEPAAENLSADQDVFLAAGAYDGNTVSDANQTASLIKGKKQVKIYNTSAHGTDLFREYPELLTDLVKWLKE